MTYYGTRRNWWSQLIRLLILLITLQTITQHSMPEIDASRAQQQTNQHMMMGLGGGAKSASNGGRLREQYNPKYFMKLAACRRAAAAMGTSPSTQAEQMQALEPVATTGYTSAIVDALRTTPAPGSQDLTIGAKLMVKSESWHEGNAGPWSVAPSVMPCYECPSCHQHKRAGYWTTLQWEASPVKDKPFTLDIRVRLVCFTLPAR